MFTHVYPPWWQYGVTTRRILLSFVAFCHFFKFKDLLLTLLFSRRCPYFQGTPPASYSDPFGVILKVGQNDCI